MLGPAGVRESWLLSWHAKRDVRTWKSVGPVLFVLGATPYDTAQLVTQQSHVQRSLTRWGGAFHIVLPAAKRYLGSFPLHGGILGERAP